jgi:hypothetical protein
MAQSLELNIKTTSDVPQAMDKAKSATVSFGKQVEDIKKKFSTGFKDIFLGFTAPMVLLQGAISYISASIRKAKQDAKEGLALLATGESRFSSSEESRAAAFFKRKKELEDEKKTVEAGKSDVTRQILKNEGGMFRDFNLPDQYVRRLREGSVTMDQLSKDKEVQKLAMEYFKKTDEGRKLLESLGPDKAGKAADFKAPEGFGNVIGVGANPVMEAMNAQTEELKRQTELLTVIATSSPAGLPPDFTKTATT